MTKPVRLSRDARTELHEAARRYGEQRPELRVEFLAAVDDAMERLVRLARHLGSPPGVDPALGVKRVFVKRFRSRSTSSSYQPDFGYSRSPMLDGDRSTGATVSERRWPAATALLIR